MFSSFLEAIPGKEDTFLAGFVTARTLVPTSRCWTVLPAVVLIIMSAVSGLAEEVSPPGDRAPAGCYRVYQSIQVHSDIERFDGHIQLLQDDRVIGTIREDLWGSDDARWCSDGTPLKDFCASIQKEPLLPAMVRLVGIGGFVHDNRTMRRELASMSVHRLYGDERPTYLITVDHSIGQGSYNGPATRLAEVKAGKLAWLTAFDANDGKEDEISLTESLKKRWRLFPRSDGKGQDILKVACWRRLSKSVEETGDEFEVIYSRFHFDGNRWLKFERTKPGYFDEESDFPARDEFP